MRKEIIVKIARRFGCSTDDIVVLDSQSMMHGTLYSILLACRGMIINIFEKLDGSLVILSEHYVTPFDVEKLLQRMRFLSDIDNAEMPVLHKLPTL